MLGVGGYVRITHNCVVYRDDAVARYEQQTGCAGGRVSAACTRGPERAQTPLRGYYGQVRVPDGRLRRNAHYEHKEQKR